MQAADVKSFIHMKDASRAHATRRPTDVCGGAQLRSSATRASAGAGHAQRVARFASTPPQGSAQVAAYGRGCVRHVAAAMITGDGCAAGSTSTLARRTKRPACIAACLAGAAVA